MRLVLSPQRKVALVVSILAVTGVVLWLSQRDEPGVSVSVPATPMPLQPAGAEALPAGRPVATPASPPPVTLTPAAAMLASAVSDRQNPQGALQAVEQTLLFFRRALGENPVGQNEDITAALLGENSARAAFLPQNSAAVREGRLVDAWGTPYWFHPVSAREMEIRSAGPDRELFTSDDLVVGK